MADRKLSKLEQQRKERSLLELNALGYSHAEIALIEGYSSSKAVSRAISRAREKQPATVEVMRSDSAAALDYVSKKMVEIIDNPQPQHTSIGRTMWNVTTCDCPNGGTSESRADHTKECAIIPAINQANITGAAKLLVKVNESHRKLQGTDKRQPMSEDEAMLRANAFLAQFPIPTYTAEVLSVTPGEPPDGDGDQDGG